MDTETIRQLNDINRRFYEQTAQPFSQTRGAAWPGWARLLPHLPDGRPLHVLDAGCGNGRFGVFLAGHVAGRIHYTGLDNNAALLADAASALAALPDVDATLLPHDLITGTLDTESRYDFVGLFGVIHHVPGADHRRAFLQTLADCVKPGGILAFAAWRFYDVPRLRERIVAWPDDLRAQVEPHDYLLDWRRDTHALRYCHYVDEAEHAALVAATGLSPVETFYADGASGDMNRYSVLKK